MRLITPFALIAMLVLLPPSVSAHAEIVSSTPEAGSTVDAAPDAVSASFSQKLAPDESSLTVLDAQGTRADNDDSAVDPSDSAGKTMRITLKDNLAAGTYTVEWKTMSAEDGETTDGQFQFTLSAAAQPSPSAQASASPRPSAGASARPTASPPASAAAAASAAASPAPSAAGGAQPGTLPETGAAVGPLGYLAVLAGVLLGISLLLRRRLRQ